MVLLRDLKGSFEPDSVQLPSFSASRIISAKRRIGETFQFVSSGVITLRLITVFRLIFYRQQLIHNATSEQFIRVNGSLVHSSIPNQKCKI